MDTFATLALDASWEPVARLTWQRAVTLLFAGRVEVVDEYPDREIRSMSFSLKVPAVVRFLEAVKGRKRAVKFSRENVYLRDHGRCGYCAQRVPREEVTYDHVTPRSQGGQTVWDNVISCCVPCNQKKGGRTPAQAKMRLLAKPVRPKKLPEVRFAIFWRPGMPSSWRQWLRDQTYWHGELDHDG